MIISASRRTDIPAFYSDWFINQIKDGSFLSKNPYNNNIYKKEVSPDTVDAIAFWTRNAKKMNKDGHFDYLKDEGYNFYFQYTVTGYNKFLESNTLHPLKAIDNINELADKFGADKIIWRFDPMFTSTHSDINELIRLHTKISSLLHPDISENVISFLDDYKKVGRNLKAEGISFNDILNNSSELHELLTALSENSTKYNRKISTCAENLDLSSYNIKKGKCIDPDYLNRVFNLNLGRAKDQGQRKECGCIKSFDVGVYDTCVHGCKYCYATQNNTIANMNYKKHDPNNKFIIPDSRFDMSNRIL